MINRPVTRPSNVKSSDGLGSVPEIRVFGLIETAKMAWKKKSLIMAIKLRRRKILFNLMD